MIDYKCKDYEKEKKKVEISGKKVKTAAMSCQRKKMHTR